MKTQFAFTILCSTMLAANAAVIQFNLSPPGTDAAVGLSPLNEVPPVLDSSGGGTGFPDSISFDTDSSVLSLGLVYGGVFGDLSGSVTGIHIHGPAPAGQNADTLFDLTDFNIPFTPTEGMLFGAVFYPQDQVAGLLAGLNYINIQTTLNPNGEIRGQLIPLLTSTPSAAQNSPPTVQCAENATIECGTATVSANVGDADGDALVVVWTVNGADVQTNQVAGGTPPTAATVQLVASFSPGANEVAVTVSDSQGQSATCSTVVTVVDTTPPVLSELSTAPAALWPPNHKMVPVTVSADVADACSAAAWQIVAVSSDEPANGKGDGNSASDWEITGDHTVLLRAERSGKGAGRVYTIFVQAVDAAGNVSAPEMVTVTVAQHPAPKGKGAGGKANLLRREEASRGR